MALLNAVLIIILGIAVIVFRRHLTRLQIVTLEELKVVPRANQVLEKALTVVAVMFGIMCLGIGVFLLVNQIA
jgi:hypothetical protein